MIPTGTVAAVATNYRMYTGDTERFRFAQAWRIDPDLRTGWGYDVHPKAFYQIEVTGSPSYTVLWEPDGDGMADALDATTATVVNAIPFVCDAAPGIQTTLDLPMISFSGTLREPSRT